MISVIVPVYNVKDYLDICIDSIISQSYKNLEIILIDDGSIDGSEEICDRYAKENNRIRVIHKSNGGLSDARNVGIEAATGDYISFIDSDDFIMPDYFSYLHTLITAGNYDMAVCQTIVVDENNKITSTQQKLNCFTVHGNEECMKAFLSGKYIDTTAWRKLYKKRLFDSDIRYPVGKFHEDVFTTYKLVARCNAISVGNKPLYAYRRRSGSIINSTFSPKHMDAIEGAIERYHFINNNYPSFEDKAARGILYAANTCSLRIATSHTDPSPYLSILQPLYRKYIWKYLKSNCRIVSKIYAIFATTNLKLLIKIISHIC